MSFQSCIARSTNVPFRDEKVEAVVVVPTITVVVHTAAAVVEEAVVEMEVVELDYENDL